MARDPLAELERLAAILDKRDPNDPELQHAARTVLDLSLGEMTHDEFARYCETLPPLVQRRALRVTLNTLRPDGTVDPDSKTTFTVGGDHQE